MNMGGWEGVQALIEAQAFDRDPDDLLPSS